MSMTSADPINTSRSLTIFTDESLFGSANSRELILIHKPAALHSPARTRSEMNNGRLYM